MFRNYFKIAWRNLARNKVYAIINISGLALGTCACLIIYLVTSFELSYDNFHPQKERIYRVVCDIHSKLRGVHQIGTVPDPVPAALREEVTGFEQLAVFYNYLAKVSVPEGHGPAVRRFDAPRYGESDIVIAEPSYFDIFAYRWLAGHPATALSEPFKVVLTESKARKYFGDTSPEAVIGRQLLYNDSLRVTVSGIVQDHGKNTDFFFRDFISFATVQHSFLKNEFTFDQWGNFHGERQTFVKLAKGTRLPHLYTQLSAFAQRHMQFPDGDQPQLRLQPLRDIHYNSSYGDAYSRKAHLPTLYGLMGISVFILLIAAINFINLSTAQSIERSKEVGIRKVLGGHRRHLVLQFLSETFILTLLAILLSLFLATPILQLFQAFIPDGVRVQLFSRSTFLFLGLLALLTTLLAGLYPALVLSAYLPALSLKGASMQKGNQRGYLRKGLIVFQFTISLVFIISTLVIGHQMRFMLHKDMGFNKDAIITLNTGRHYPSEKKALLAARIRQLPGVAMVSTSEGTPAAAGHRATTLQYRGKDLVKIDCQMQLNDEYFAPLYGLQFVAGRNLLPSDTMKEFLVNESCARALGFRHPADAIGQLVESGQNDAPHRKQLPIVGVLADFHGQSLHEPIKPTFFTNVSGANRTLSIQLATQGRPAGHFKEMLARIAELWKAVYPNEKFEYAFFDDTIARFYEKEQKTAQLMNTAMAIAIFISCMGLFGLAAFTAQQRTREIGIRKVLGASTANIATMLSKDFILLVAVALVAASPVAWYCMHRWLENFAYRTTIAWWIFAIAGLSAMLIALLTVSFQAVKAAVASPVKSLRTE